MENTTNQEQAQIIKENISNRDFFSNVWSKNGIIRIYINQKYGRANKKGRSLGYVELREGDEEWTLYPHEMMRSGDREYITEMLWDFEPTV